MPRLSRREAQQYRLVVDNYRLLHGIVGTYDCVREAVAWGVAQGHLPPPPDPLSHHCERAAEALREEGAEGEEGRARLNVITTVTNPETGKVVQRSLWGDTDDPSVPDEFKVEAVRQQLERVRSDFRSIEKTVERIALARPRLRPRLVQMLADFDPHGDAGFSEAGA